jgi:hypothetical protein
MSGLAVMRSLRQDCPGLEALQSLKSISSKVQGRASEWLTIPYEAGPILTSKREQT